MGKAEQQLESIVKRLEIDVNSPTAKIPAVILNQLIYLALLQSKEEEEEEEEEENNCC